MNHESRICRISLFIFRIIRVIRNSLPLILNFKNMKQTSLKIRNPKSAIRKTKVKNVVKTNVGDLVDYYLVLRGWANLPKEEYKKRQIIYGRFTRPAKHLLILTDQNLERAKYLLDCVKRWAELKHLDWSIETVFKRWGEIEKEVNLSPREAFAAKNDMMSLKDIIKKIRE